MSRRPLAQRLQHLETRHESVTPRAFARRLRVLDAQVEATRGAPSIAEALYVANARTPLFQLEALARACREVVDERAFEPLLVDFKTLEDGLGAVDFADGVMKRIANGDGDLRAFMLGRRTEAANNVNRRLVLDGWRTAPGAVSDAMDRIVDALEDVHWPKPRKERQRYREYYADRANGIQERLERDGFDFDALEAGVHELRRRMRWLSILPASLDGLFVRDEREPIDKALASYCTPDVVNSPYNKLAPHDDVPDPIVLDSSAFLAMSWLIARIGEWKDRAQWSEAILEGLRALGENSKNAITRARRILGKDLVAHGVVAKSVGALAGDAVRDKIFARLGATAG
jgi:hypothetical protein